MAAPTAAQDQDAKITLHWLEQSRSQRIVWMFEELSIPYTLKTYKRGSDMLAEEALKTVHPLGKSPVITVEVEGQPTRVIPESGAIVEFLGEYYGARNGHAMVPRRWKEGMEGKIGGETEEWDRYKYFVHYAEGSLMALLVLGLIIQRIKAAPGAPFFVKPLTKAVGDKVEQAFLNRNFERHFAFLEERISSSPGGGEFFCGKDLTGADILMVYPLEAAKDRAGLNQKQHPKLCAYVERIKEREAYKRAVKKIVDETGSFKATV